MNKKKPILTLLLSLLLFTMIMTTGVGATVTTNTAAASYTLYYDSTNGNMYTNENCTDIYRDQSNQWNTVYDTDTNRYILELNGFHFTTSAPNALVLTDDTTIYLSDHSVNTITSTYVTNYDPHDDSNGILAKGGLTLLGVGDGTGSLEVHSGWSTGVFSCGVSVNGNFKLISGHLFTYGGIDTYSSGLATSCLDLYSGEITASGSSVQGNDSIVMKYNAFNTYMIFEDKMPLIFCKPFINAFPQQILYSGDLGRDFFDHYNTTHIYFTLTDVPYNAWYYSYVYSMYDNDIINGYANSDGVSYEIRPDNAISRAEFVTILANMFCDESQLSAYTGASSFADVPTNNWALKYINWATANNFVYGLDSAHFAPNENITREQMAAILYRIVNKMNLTTDINKTTITFTDAGSISDFAQIGVAAMQKVGIINGLSNGDGSYRFNPKGQATRAEAITMLYNFISAYLNK